MFNEPVIIGFFLVFVRCSAMMLSSPVFGAQNIPVHIRILTGVAISGAITMAVSPGERAVPNSMYELAASVALEAFAGLLIGGMMSLTLQLGQIAGAILDFQVGLSMGQIMNPVTGVSVTVLSQFKFMLGMVTFLSLDGHHLILEALVRSYDLMPTVGPQLLDSVRDGFVHLIGVTFMLALQIAAPVIGVSLLLDAALGLINRAVPQMQVMVVGAPAKLGVGLLVLSMSLPAIASGVSAAVGQGLQTLSRVWGA